MNDIIGRLEAKAAAKRDRAKSAADAEYLADMESIKRLASLDGDGAVGAVLPVPQVKRTIEFAADPENKKGKRVGGRKNGPTAAVRKAIAQIGSGVSVGSLSDFFEKVPANSAVRVNKPAIYSSLNKMMTAGEIERVPASNGHPSTYRIIKLKEIQ